MLPMQPANGEVVSFLGGGNMARALIAGLLREGWPPEHIRVGEPSAPAREALQRDLGVFVSADNDAALEHATLVVLAVKPQDAAQALQALRARRSSMPLLSIAAGLPVARLQQACEPGTPVVRAMPNRPALLGAGITGLYAPAEVPEGIRRRAQAIVAAAGRTVWLRIEAELDVVTALSGSGPAYFLLFAEQLCHAAEGLGLAPDTAALLAAETLYGAGMLAHQGADGAAAALAAERVAVTSKGGTTEAALRVFAAADLQGLVARALQAAAARSAELARAEPDVPSSGRPRPPAAR